MNNILSHIPEINFADKANYLVNATSVFLARTDAQAVIETSKVAVGIFLAIAALAITVRYCYNRFHKAAVVLPAPAEPTPNAPYVRAEVAAAEKIRARRIAEAAAKQNKTNVTPAQAETQSPKQVAKAFREAGAVMRKPAAAKPAAKPAAVPTPVSAASKLGAAVAAVATVVATLVNYAAKLVTGPTAEEVRKAKQEANKAAQKAKSAQLKAEKAQKAKEAKEAKEAATLARAAEALRGPASVDNEFDPEVPFPNAKPRSPANVQS